MTSYELGFLTKCAEHGINAAQLLKAADTGGWYSEKHVMSRPPSEWKGLGVDKHSARAMLRRTVLSDAGKSPLDYNDKVVANYDRLQSPKWESDIDSGGGTYEPPTPTSSAARPQNAGRPVSRPIPDLPPLPSSPPSTGPFLPLAQKTYERRLRLGI